MSIVRDGSAAAQHGDAPVAAQPEKSHQGKTSDNKGGDGRSCRAVGLLIILAPAVFAHQDSAADAEAKGGRVHASLDGVDQIDCGQRLASHRVADKDAVDHRVKAAEQHRNHGRQDVAVKISVQLFFHKLFLSSIFLKNHMTISNYKL